MLPASTSPIMYWYRNYYSATDSEEIQRKVNVLGNVCWGKKLKANVSRSKVMSQYRGYSIAVSLNRERMKQSEFLGYLGTNIHEPRRMNQEISHEVREGGKLWEALRILRIMMSVVTVISQHIYRAWFHCLINCILIKPPVLPVFLIGLFRIKNGTLILYWGSCLCYHSPFCV